MSGRYLEDFAIGQVYKSPGRLKVEAEAIKRFAAEFDPQPFHLDEQTAKDTFFGSLAASGWHTAALTMRLLVESDLSPDWGIIGVGGEVSWPGPLRPGDEIRIESEILDVRPSKSNPAQGLIKARTTTLNQKDQPVQILIANLFIPRRSAA